MENIIDEKNFINSVQLILQNFVTNNFDEDDPINNVYCAFDYDEVRQTFNHINEGNLGNKPVIHFVLNGISNSDKIYLNSEGLKGERNYLTYSLYIVVNDSYQDNKKRKFLLNELSSNLKYKFDNYRINLEKFHKVRLSPSEGVLGKNSDNLYANKQELNFRCDKPL